MGQKCKVYDYHTQYCMKIIHFLRVMIFVTVFDEKKFDFVVSQFHAFTMCGDCFRTSVPDSANAEVCSTCHIAPIALPLW